VTKEKIHARAQRLALDELKQGKLDKEAHSKASGLIYFFCGQYESKRRLRKTNVAPSDFDAATIIFESERGCVLIMSSLLDDDLADLLRGAFKVRSAVSDKFIAALLTDHALPPLGTFSIRTKVCLALGLITEKESDALDHMRDLRNKCAHKALAVVVPDQVVESLLAALEPHEAAVARALAVGISEDEQPSSPLLAEIDLVRRLVNNVALTKNKMALAIGAFALSATFKRRIAKMKKRKSLIKLPKPKVK
jgi:DNA-binding MltR family transcriptional regulator